MTKFTSVFSFLSVVLFLLIFPIKAFSLDFRVICDDPTHRLLHRNGYMNCFDIPNRISHFVTYRLTREMVNTRVAPRENYKKDFDIPNSLQYADFTNTNFDRGHLVPASDMNSNKYYAKDAALITNIVPQFPRFNRYGLWRESERYGQELAKKYGEIIVIAGPLYKDENIRGFVIQVPSHYFKIFVYEVDGAKLYLAYVFPHSNDNNRNIQNYRKPLEEVKRLANIRN